MAVSGFPTTSKRFRDERFSEEQVAGTILPSRQPIVLVGDSLLIDSIEAALSTKPNLAVVRLTSIGDRLGPHVPLSPKLVIVDLQAVLMAPILAYLLEFPGVPVLGIEINSNQVIALSSRQYTAECSDDLTQIIKVMAA
jgi:hypothetical protein